MRLCAPNDLSEMLLKAMNVIAVTLALAAIVCRAVQAEPNNPNTDWFRDAQFGAFMHFLPGDQKQLALVKEFDVKFLANQLAASGVGYFVVTLGQNSGFLNSPNAAYDRLVGYAPGERCSTRDLPLDLHRALQSKRIRLMLYLPCQPPNEDPQAQRAFGLPEGRADQPLNLDAARKWAAVIQEWSDRYGDKVAGWWFDGGYQHVKFDNSVAHIYALAAKHGNPRSIVTFNPGVKVIHWTDAEDYTAGELNEPFSVVPTARWVDGSQWHALTYLGTAWGRRDTRFSDRQWVDWVKAVAAMQGVVTLDMGPNWNPDRGPIGSLAKEQLNQAIAVRSALK